MPQINRSAGSSRYVAVECGVIDCQRAGKLINCSTQIRLVAGVSYCRITAEIAVSDRSRITAVTVKRTAGDRAGIV